MNLTVVIAQRQRKRCAVEDGHGRREFYPSERSRPFRSDHSRLDDFPLTLKDAVRLAVALRDKPVELLR